MYAAPFRWFQRAHWRSCLPRTARGRPPDRCHTAIEPDPRSALPRLVLQVGRLVEFLVVVDAERTHGSSGSGAHAADLRSEEARGHAGHHHDGREAVEVRHARADGIAGNLGVVPLDRERDRRCAQDAEVVGVVRVLPDVLAIHDQVFSECLLKPGVEFIAKAGSKRWE